MLIRQYVGIPPKWVTYIYDNFGIFTMVNHTVGRYGFNIDGAWVPRINYADAKTRKVIAEDVRQYAKMYHGTRGVLLWLLGNENNYGLEWQSFEIENLPKDEQHRARAEHLYSMMSEIMTVIRQEDPKVCSLLRTVIYSILTSSRSTAVKWTSWVQMFIAAYPLVIFSTEFAMNLACHSYIQNLGPMLLTPRQ